MKDFLKFDAVGLAELVRNKEVSPRELLEAAVGRIESVNPKLNAVIWPLYERAAEQIDRGALSEGPLRGVPFLLKDLMTPLEGAPMAMGTQFLKAYVPDHSAELVRRIEKAGLVIVGKTNTPEFGIQPTTEPLAFGPTRNPWNLERTPGGSSGGSAAAVAAGMVPMAHGNDGGGSIRIPASCCGLFGMKSTRGRISMAPDLGDVLSGLAVEGVLTRSVRDAAIFFDVASGPVPGDPYYPPPQEIPFSKLIEQDPPSLRIAYSTAAPLGGKVDFDCQEAVKETVKLLASLGHNIVGERNIHVEEEFFQRYFLPVWASAVSQTLQLITEAIGHPVTQEMVEPITWGLYEIAREKTSADYLVAINQFQRFSREVAARFEEFDIWVTPTLCSAPLPIGNMVSPPEDPLRGFFRGKDFASFTAVYNVTGQPAMSVPLYWNEEGLPIGSQLAAPYAAEGVLFQLAAQLERARPWAQRRPPNR